MMAFIVFLVATLAMAVWNISVDFITPDDEIRTLLVIIGCVVISALATFLIVF